MFARDEAPGLDNSDDSHQCDGDLIGVWKATTDATEVVVGNDGDVTLNDSNSPLSLEIVGQSKNKCEFWGFGALGAPILAQRFAKDDTNHVTMLQMGPLANGISKLKQHGFSIVDDEDKVTIIGSYAGLSEDLGTGVAGSVAYQKADDNVDD